VTFTAFYRNIPALSILVAVTFNHPRPAVQRTQSKARKSPSSAADTITWADRGRD